MNMNIELQSRLIEEFLKSNYPDNWDKVDFKALLDSELSFPENKARIELELVKNEFETPSEAIPEAENNELKEKLFNIQKRYEELQRQKIRVAKYVPINGFTQKIEPISVFDFKELFSHPNIIGLIGDQQTGKSNTLYWILKELGDNYSFDVWSYGLRNVPDGVRQIYSVVELEQIRNSVVIIDEMFSLFDLEDRKQRHKIEKTIRLIYHNNNILLICGLGENFRKFISAKLNAIIFKKTTLSDLVNGSRVKEILLGYNGEERGSSVLDLDMDEAVIFDGKHYQKIKIPYMEIYDSKIGNVDILVSKNVQKG